MNGCRSHTYASRPGLSKEIAAVDLDGRRHELELLDGDGPLTAAARGAFTVVAAAPGEEQRSGDGDACQALTNGLTAFSTCDLDSVSSNASGAGASLASSRMAAAWRASTCTIDPAAASTSLDLIDGAAPL